MTTLNFSNHFVDELPGDPIADNYRRQVSKACYSLVHPTTVAAPTLLSYSPEAAALIDLSPQDCESDWFLNAFSGNEIAHSMQPHAMCYGGHQFGHWAGQLGDGRAIVLGDVKNKAGQNWSLQLKGSGPTPYSRTADGLAVLRSSVREYLCSEAMHHLGVPTTRALSLMTTGEEVVRDIMYNGNPAPEPGAIVCRMAPSFIRFGNFQIFASRKEYDELRRLADYTIEHHFPNILNEHDQGSKSAYLAWFQEICDRTSTMIVEWSRVGFVHGVMNTDNMSIHGLTIDYGPYGWLDNFDPDWTPNTTDAENRRYRFGQQANVALWNCLQLANALYPLIEETKGLERVLEFFQAKYHQKWMSMMRSKLGLHLALDDDQQLIADLEGLLAKQETDFTLFYRALATDQLQFEAFEHCFYTDKVSVQHQQVLSAWLVRYQQRLTLENASIGDRIDAMNKVNPLFVFRNYLAQQAIDKAESGDVSMVNELLEVFRNPYTDQAGMSVYRQKRPEWARTKVGCSMLSCSS